MRICFLGTSAFAVPTLEALIRNPSVEVAAVVTQEDRPQGRGHHVLPTPVKVCALEHQRPVYQPAKIRSDPAREFLEAQAPDLLVVVSYGQILPTWLLELPRFGAINVHASLLPKFRGAAPIQWCLLLGETQSGVTIMQMDAGMDTGPILLQDSVAVGVEETAGELHDRLALIGATLLDQAIAMRLDGPLAARPQDSALASNAPKITKEMGRLDWSRSSTALHNQIRALNPRPGCVCRVRGLEMKVWRSRLAPIPSSGPPDVGRPGSIRFGSHGNPLVTCGDGCSLELLEVNLPSRHRISGGDLVHGLQLEEGDGFENGPTPTPVSR